MNALEKVQSTGVTTPLLAVGKRFLVRGWIEGVPLQIARPTGDLHFFTSAREALRTLHRAGYVHNDLAKQQNWLRGADGEAWLMDFQLAMPFSRRSKIGRVLAYEDLRHLLKHKRTYCPEALTPASAPCSPQEPAHPHLDGTASASNRFVTRTSCPIRTPRGAGPRVHASGRPASPMR